MALPERRAERKAILCNIAGGNGNRTVSKWAFAITASRSRFGIPFRFVLPSFASAKIVSSSDSNCSAGRISATKCASPGRRSRTVRRAGRNRQPLARAGDQPPAADPEAEAPRSTWKRSS